MNYTNNKALGQTNRALAGVRGTGDPSSILGGRSYFFYHFLCAVTYTKILQEPKQYPVTFAAKSYPVWDSNPQPLD